MDKKKKKSSLGPGILLCVAMMIVSSLAERADNSDLAAGIGIIVIAIVAALGYALKWKKKKGGRGADASVVRNKTPDEVPLHSHDQLNKNGTVRCTDGYEHWVNQLNGFLVAGIIDKAEYRVLLKKHPRESFDSKK